ncbi:MAG: hypothetical protein MR605_03035 [Bacteroidales bacterium]|nr:hypothetical protein [Bacteroidales bacterium]MDY4557329.1 hypothetical protein [Alloprevotella sp.]
MDVREEQYAKLLSPKLVTDVGIVIEVREEQPQKQPSSKLVTEEGIIVFIHPETMVLLSVLIIALQFSRESYKGLLSSTVIDVRAEHPKKHPSPNFVTDDGMVIDVREEQLKKHDNPKLVTDVGIMIDVREEQPQKQRFPKLVMVSGM